jgi:uncharacterized damage-inducible protein DinB
MDVRLAPLAMILDLNTDLLLNGLEGLSDNEAQRRLPGGGNSVAFLAAHLTDSRHFLATRLGQSLANPLARYLADAKSIDEIRSWATLDQVRAAWLSISTHLQMVLESLGPEEIGRANAHRFPIPDTTTLGMIAFLTQHDSYHIGQLGFVRRQLGKPAMTFTRGIRAAAPTAAVFSLGG